MKNAVFWDVSVCGSCRNRHIPEDDILQRLRVSENRVLRICAPKKDEVTKGWRGMHNEELRDLSSSPSTIRMIKSRR
jgi:hypothetical protein